MIYFGDTARMPYGSKSAATIKNFSMQVADFLVENDVKMIVIACNTVSAIALDELKAGFKDTPVIGIIEPAAEKTAGVCSSNNRIGVIGTKATVSSGAYERSIKSINDKLNVFSIACPAFVPLIEEGMANSDIMDLTIKYYMDDFILENRIDTVVLGCTHYPMISGNIKRIYHDIRVINPSQEIVTKIKSELASHELFAEDSKCANNIYASDFSVNFVQMIDRIFENTDVRVTFKNLER